jgi:hypothetical protein
LVQYRLPGEKGVEYEEQHFARMAISVYATKTLFYQSLTNMFVDLLELLAMTFAPGTNHDRNWCW